MCFKVAEFVHLPALMDHKYFGQLGDGQHIEIPKADVGIISGGIRNEEHLEVAEEMRKNARSSSPWAPAPPMAASRR
jgi:F420-non-reducing hydrogenase small subunit